MEEPVLIERDTTTYRDVAFSEVGRRLTPYIISKSGTGKSALLERIAYQDMLNGEGFIFIDPHEVSAEQVLRLVPSTQANDVIFWDPTNKARPFGINPICLFPRGYDYVSNEKTS